MYFMKLIYKRVTSEYFIFEVFHSTLLLLPPLWLHCVGGMLGLNQDCCNLKLITLPDAGLMYPRSMCPRLKVLGCCAPWTKRPLDTVPLTDVSQPWTASRMDRTTHGCHRKLLKNRYLGMGWLGQGHNRQGTLCPRDAASKNFRSGTHRSGHIGRGRTNIAPTAAAYLR
jgi:hypothetical protein